MSGLRAGEPWSEVSVWGSHKTPSSLRSVETDDVSVTAREQALPCLPKALDFLLARSGITPDGHRHWRAA